MRSWSAMAHLLCSRSRKTIAESGALGDRFLRARNRFDDDPARIGGIAPMADPDPLVRFKVLIMGEEMFDLLQHDRRQILPLADIGVIRKGRVDWDADQFLIAAMLVLEVKDANRA